MQKKSIRVPRSLSRTAWRFLTSRMNPAVSARFLARARACVRKMFRCHIVTIVTNGVLFTRSATVATADSSRESSAPSRRCSIRASAPYMPPWAAHVWPKGGRLRLEGAPYMPCSAVRPWQERTMRFVLVGHVGCRMAGWRNGRFARRRNGRQAGVNLASCNLAVPPHTHTRVYARARGNTYDASHYHLRLRRLTRAREKTLGLQFYASLAMTGDSRARERKHQRSVYQELGSRLTHARVRVCGCEEERQDCKMQESRCPVHAMPGGAARVISQTIGESYHSRQLCSEINGWGL